MPRISRGGITLFDVTDGVDGVAATFSILTNEADVAPARSPDDSDGDVSGVVSEMRTFAGSTRLTSGVSYAVNTANPSQGVTAVINSSTGVISYLGSLTGDSVSFTFRATRGSDTFDKVMSITRVSTGVHRVVATRYTFSYDGAGAGSGTDIVVSASTQGLDGLYTWTASNGATIADTDNSITFSRAQFETSNTGRAPVTITAVRDGVSDTVTIFPVTEGASGDNVAFAFLVANSTPATPTDGPSPPTAPVTWFATAALALTSQALATGFSLYVSTGTQSGGSGDFVWGVAQQQSGNDGAPGGDGLRTTSGILYTTLPRNSAPTDTPSNTNSSYSFSTNAFTMTPALWTEDIPSQSASQTSPFYQVRWTATEVTAGGTVTLTFGTQRTLTVFTGVVRFAGNTLSDGSANFDTGNVITGAGNALNTALASAATIIDGDRITTGSITVGNASNLFTGTGVPTGNQTGARIQRDGTMVIGSASEYLRWDGSVLSIQGEISNLSQQYLDAKAGSWEVTSRSTNNLQNELEGIGIYRFILVGAGGTGGSASTDVGMATGGGGGGWSSWTMQVNNLSTQMSFDGANSALSNFTRNDTGNGIQLVSNSSRSIFRVAGEPYFIANGGGGGNAGYKGRSGGASLVGGTAGSGSQNANTLVANGVIYDISNGVGGAGGSVNMNTGNNIASLNARHAAASGGGGISFFEQGKTANGGPASVNFTSNSSRGTAVATAGGGGFGPGLSQGVGNFSNTVHLLGVSTSLTDLNNSGGGRAIFQSLSTELESTILDFGQDDLGSYFGTVPQGQSVAVAYGASGRAPAPAAPGVSGGGSAAFGPYDINTITQALTAQSGGLLGGGGGGTSLSNNVKVFPGRGGIGGGGGGGVGGGNQGANQDLGFSGRGGPAGLFWLKL